jgi:hypothetical protein
MKRFIILCVSALFLGGCATTFTSIEPNVDGSYTLTRVKQGFFYVGGNVYRCNAEGKTLSCSVINR